MTVLCVCRYEAEGDEAHKQCTVSISGDAKSEIHQGPELHYNMSEGEEPTSVRPVLLVCGSCCTHMSYMSFVLLKMSWLGMHTYR